MSSTSLSNRGDDSGNGVESAASPIGKNRLESEDRHLSVHDDDNEVEKLVSTYNVSETMPLTNNQVLNASRKNSKSSNSSKSTNWSKSSKSPLPSEVLVQKFDPNMFEKFKKNKIEFVKSDDKTQIEKIDNLEARKLIEEVHKSIDETASKFVFSWHNLPVVFPPPVADISSIDLESLFKFPTFDELDEVAIDASGNRRRLNEQQLNEIKRNGEFEVESKHFEGKTHRWVLSRLLQKGYVNSNKSFFRDMANSLHFLIITAKRRFYWKCFSIRSGISFIAQSIYDFIDLLIGLPQMRVVGYESKLLIEKIKFMVAELKIDPSQQEMYNNFCNHLNLALEHNSYARERWIFPYLYRAPDNLVIDLRLYDTGLQKKIAPELAQLLKIDSNERQILNKLRDDSITLFTNEGHTDAEIIEKTTKIVYKEYLKRLNTRLLNSAKLEEISPGIGKLLWEHAQAVRLIEQVVDEITNEFNSHVSAFKEKLKNDHPIKSLVYDWLQECIDREKETYLKKNSFLMHQKAIEKCREERLFQATYFLIREMLFYRDHEKQLIAKFEKIKEPTKTFKFHRLIWFPNNYIIERSTDLKYYTLKKEIIYETTNRHPFWRWQNFFMRTGVYFSNLIFFLGIAIPFASAFSYTALFKPSPFYPGKRIESETGVLQTDYNSKTLTYISRLRSIWNHVSASIQKFENTADKGLISKSVQRIFNRVWNYVFVGFLGSLGLTLIYPPLCLLISTGSLVLLLLSPIWFPILIFVGHLGLIFFFDWDYPRARVFRLFQIVILKFLIAGLLQPIAAFITATVICPLTSLVLLIFGVLRKSMRKTWDSMMFYIVIKRQAKVPSGNTFLAKRLAGPGLSANYFFQARAELVLISLEANLEAKMIRAYFAFVEKKLREPLTCYTDFFNPLCNRYSYTINQSHGPYSLLNSNVNHYLNLYRKETERRTGLLKKAIEDPKIKNIRLLEKDLEVVYFESIKIVRKHYDEILKFQEKNVNDFFEDKQLNSNDWEALTKIELEEVFGVGINTPLEQTDTYFDLAIDHLDFGKYSKMIAESKLRDDLDAEHVNYTPKRSRKTFVEFNEDSVSLFDPKHDIGKKFYDASNNSALSKITIPTQLPSHLAKTALLVDKMFRGEGGELKFTCDQVMTAVNKNEHEANRLL